MKIRFKHQQFQLDAVQSVVDCFRGQPNGTPHIAAGRGISGKPEQFRPGENLEGIGYSDDGFGNRPIQLTDPEVLENIRTVQRRNGLKPSEKIERRKGETIYNLTVEMETGTGKTYTYIRTMFELYRTYGWSKYIVVVPSIAIREGVLKTFRITEDHFMAEYGMKARYFVYNSKQLHQIGHFAGDSGLSVMIINAQAFNARGKDARRIHMELDDFQSRRPIDVLADTNPILVIDEPQSVEGKQTIESLKAFKPLFTLRYSATHREAFNKVYRLDALDAYNLKLVKKISVKGISARGISGTDGYLYLEGIDISADRAPAARLELDVKTKTGLARKTMKIAQNDDLYHLSGGLEQYRGYRVSEINGLKGSVSFVNGVTLYAGDVRGDAGELHFRRIQIRETIKSHFEKERMLYPKGIKVLSLFFIDEVAKYRQYDENGAPKNGVYADMFEEEYAALLDELMSQSDEHDPYIQYLKRIDVRKTHNGYFSIDKKSNRLVDPKVSGRKTDSDDAEAYSLIMRDKERLLSLSEDVRFIFSHSALREGWDNPNVFQICTLKHSDSAVKKRQEVGRGLRLCVNQHGERMDASVPGIDVHEINVLTVIASESYEQFAKQLQQEIAEALSERPRTVDERFFRDKVLTNGRGEPWKLDEAAARKLHVAFIKNDYVDERFRLTDAYFRAVEAGGLKLPEEFAGFGESIVELLKSVYTEGRTNLVEDERKKKLVSVNQNFYRKEFRELWNRINRKSVYTVKFDSEELIRKCVQALDDRLQVPAIRFAVRHGEMKHIRDKEQLQAGEAFEMRESGTETVEAGANIRVKYDLVGKLVEETKLTRRTIVAILTGIRESTFLQFRRNPEEFLIRAARIINEEKATTIIESITYDVLNDRFENEIFTKNALSGKPGENALPAHKHVLDYVVADSKIGRNFAENLEAGREVLVYARLPKGFFIPTPVGNYNPDWAIVFREGHVKHIYFIAETKGSMESMELRETEKAKIECARKHFAKLGNGQIRYDVADSYEKLLEIVKG